ncbi:MAG: hypothetical protein JW384_03645 [Nitrosomonadaceae bacterium]|nr:hypothetical protein [Nitrosomonadaceae bacterium]
MLRAQRRPPPSPPPGSPVLSVHRYYSGPDNPGAGRSRKTIMEFLRFVSHSQHSQNARLTLSRKLWRATLQELGAARGVLSCCGYAAKPFALHSSEMPDLPPSLSWLSLCNFSVHAWFVAAGWNRAQETQIKVRYICCVYVYAWTSYMLCSWGAPICFGEQRSRPISLAGGSTSSRTRKCSAPSRRRRSCVVALECFVGAGVLV